MQRRLTYVWGLSTVEWTLEPDGEGTAYTFVQAGLAFRDVPDEEGLPAGWHDFLEDLEAFLDGSAPAGRHDRQRWLSLKPVYRRELLRINPSMR